MKYLLIILFSIEYLNINALSKIYKMATAIKNVPKVITEDLGKIFEKGICGVYNTPYVGKYKYSEEEAAKFTQRLQKLPELFPQCTHTAEKGAQYDFTAINDSNTHLSAKTNKQGDKVCPQKIGQPSKKKFCEYFNLDHTTMTANDIKQYIMVNLKSMLPHYFKYTFDCPIIYYNQKSDKILFVKNIAPIDWDQVAISFSHILKEKEWNESTSISVKVDDKYVNIGEFQVHTKRDGIKFRWNFETLLKLYPNLFSVQQI